MFGYMVSSSWSGLKLKLCGWVNSVLVLVGSKAQVLCLDNGFLVMVWSEAQALCFVFGLNAFLVMVWS